MSKAERDIDRIKKDDQRKSRLTKWRRLRGEGK
jgi:hypothetical protein